MSTTLTTLTSLPTKLLLAALLDGATRADALAELARRVAEHGPTSTSRPALAAALGLGVTRTRTLLAQLDAAGFPVVVGYARERGGGVANARAALATLRAEGKATRRKPTKKGVLREKTRQGLQ